MPRSSRTEQATPADRGGPLPSRFDGFLHATVGTEREGLDMTVLSMLARAGLDPWAEAARLAQGSRTAAADSLADTIAGLPDGERSRAEAADIARRLVPLLMPGALPVPAVPASARPRRRVTATMVIACLLGGALALAILLLDRLP